MHHVKEEKKEKVKKRYKVITAKINKNMDNIESFYRSSSCTDFLVFNFYSIKKNWTRKLTMRLGGIVKGRGFQSFYIEHQVKSDALHTHTHTCTYTWESTLVAVE